MMMKVVNEHIEWAKKARESRIQRLEKLENRITKYPNTPELRTVKAEMEAEIRYCNRVLFQLREEENFSLRKPMDYVKPKYKNCSLEEAIILILNDTPHEMSADEIAREIYDPENPAELFSAKGSVSARLRDGARQKKWVKARRGRFVSKNLKAVVE